MKLPQRYPLTAALIGSLVLHGMLTLLLWCTDTENRERHCPSRHITFNFRPLTPEQIPAVQPKERKAIESEKKHVQKTPPAKTPTQPKTLKSLPPKPEVKNDPEPAEETKPDIESAPAAQQTDGQQKTTETHTARAASAPDSRARAEQKHALDNFLAQVLYRIEQAKRYPRAAQRRGISGTVTCRFVIARDGTLQASEVIAASQHTLLNKAALSAIRRGAPYPAFPSFIQGEAFSSIVDITFSLKPDI